MAKKKAARAGATKKSTSKAKKAKKTQRPLELDFLLTCDSVSRDPNTGKASLYGLFDRIWSEGFPTLARPFVVYGQVIGNGKYTVAVEFRHPGGKVEKLGEVVLECSPESTAVIEATLSGLPLSKAGDYEIRLVSNGNVVGRPKSLYVRLVTGKKSK